MLSADCILKNDNSLMAFSEDKLSIILKTRHNQVILEWHGKSKSKDPGEKLLPFFDEIIDLLKGKVVVVDFRKLEYLNSSTVPTIINLAKNLNENNIRTVVCYDKNLSWQVLSFSAFRIIALKMENVETLAR